MVLSLRDCRQTRFRRCCAETFIRDWHTHFPALTDTFRWPYLPERIRGYMFNKLCVCFVRLPCGAINKNHECCTICYFLKNFGASRLKFFLVHVKNFSFKKCVVVWICKQQDTCLHHQWWPHLNQIGIVPTNPWTFSEDHLVFSGNLLSWVPVLK